MVLELVESVRVHMSAHGIVDLGTTRTSKATEARKLKRTANDSYIEKKGSDESNIIRRSKGIVSRGSTYC